MSEVYLSKVTEVIGLFPKISYLIAVFSILTVSFAMQNILGLIYLCILLGLCAIYVLVKQNTLIPIEEDVGHFCNWFSFWYVCYPMFYLNQINYLLFSVFLLFCLLDSYSKKGYGVALIMSFISGLSAGILIPAFMIALGGINYLLLNEMSHSNKITCSMPQKQTFKCSVYKNGQLIGEQKA